MTQSQNSPAIVVLSVSSLGVAQEIKARTGGEIHGLRGRVDHADIVFDDAGTHIRDLFMSKRMIIGIMAAGALIRLIASVIGEKQTDPPVLAVADDFGAPSACGLGGYSGQ